MAKLTKESLKVVVKECLIEILEDGLLGTGPERASTLRESRQSTRSHMSQDRQGRRSIPATGESFSRSRGERVSSRPALDNIRHGAESQMGSQKRERFDSAVRETVSGITNDPIMSEIFSDTARSTLQSQNEAGMSQGPSVMEQGDHAARQVMNSDPISMFGEASQNWATLAFSDKKTPGM